MKLLRNSSALFFANAATSAAHYVILIVIARGFGSESFGSYLFATTFATLFVTIPNFGLDRIVIREVAQRHANAGRHLVAAGSVRLLLAAVALVASVATARVLGYAPATRTLILILGIALTLNLVAELLRSLFFAFENMPTEALVRAIGRAIAVLSVTLAVYLRVTMLAVAWILVGAAALEVLLYALALFRTYRLPNIVFDWDITRFLVKAALPLAISTMLVTVYFRINVVILTTYKGETVAGWFGAAFTFLQLSQFVSAAVIGATLPALAQQHLESPHLLRESLANVTRYLLVLVLPFTLFTSFAAHPLIDLVYGAGYEPAAQSLQILVWASAFMFLGSLFATVLIAMGAQKTMVAVYAGATVVSLGANLLLVPWLGAIGASVSTLATEAFVAVSFLWLIQRTFPGFSLSRLLVRPGAAALLMAVLLYAGRNANWIMLGLLTSAAYLAVSIVIGAIPREDTGRVVAFLRPRGLV